MSLIDNRMQQLAFAFNTPETSSVRWRELSSAQQTYEGCIFYSPPALSIFVPEAYSGYIRGLSVPKQHSSPTLLAADGTGVGESDTEKLQTSRLPTRRKNF